MAINFEEIITSTTIHPVQTITGKSKHITILQEIVVEFIAARKDYTFADLDRELGKYNLYISQFSMKIAELS